MQDVTITITLPQIQTAMEKAAEEIFKSTYSNPIKELLEKSIKSKEGEIQKFIDSVVANSISDPTFKEKISEIVIQRIVEAALKK